MTMTDQKLQIDPWGGTTSWVVYGIESGAESRRTMALVYGTDNVIVYY